MDTNRVRIHDVKVLSDDWHILRKTRFDYLRHDGRWQQLERETYDRGDGVTILLYNLKKKTVLLTRQFRFPAYVNGHHGFLIEAVAGLLDKVSPEQRIRTEIEEETGYKLSHVEKIMEIFMSPGSVTEKLYFFVGQYEDKERSSAGGGIEAEGEDIEVMEIPMAVALRMIGTQEIIDAKTILLLQYMQLQLLQPRSQMILIAGPYRSGTADDPALIANNMHAMEAYALPIHQAGHIPILGEWLALPIISKAGSKQIGDEVFDSIFHQHVCRLLEHCDAVLRIDGDSAGADMMVGLAHQLGKPVYHTLSEIPACK